MTVLHVGKYAKHNESVSIHVGYAIELNRICVWLQRTKVGESGSWNLEQYDPTDGDSEWKHYDDGVYRPPFMVLDNDAAQAAMAGLWSAGVRTKDSLESGAHRTSLEGHLADMRQLVAQFARVELPGTKQPLPPHQT